MEVKISDDEICYLKIWKKRRAGGTGSGLG
jgi:hypothetical protein